MTESQVRGIALFFLFSLMDEKVALQAAHKTVAHLKAVRSQEARDTDDVGLIRLLAKTHQSYRKQVTRTRDGVVHGVSTHEAWHLPEGIHFGPWAKFQKDGGEPELLAVLFSKILGFSDDAIADGLNISLGTARYRIGKGVRYLGLLVKKNEKIARA